MNIYRSGKPLSIIAAVASNYAIGKNNSMLWRIPEDFKWFRKLTLGHTVIMGKNTYLSLPRRPLPDRRNIVITRDVNSIIPGVELVPSVEAAIDVADSDFENFIIGGAWVYQQFIGLVDKLYITFIDKAFEADAFFPPIDENIWQLTEVFPQKEEHPEGLRYEFRVYLRKTVLL